MKSAIASAAASGIPTAIKAFAIPYQVHVSMVSMASMTLPPYF